MTVKTSKLGGTDWADGNVLDGDDLTDTFNYVAPLIHTRDLTATTITSTTATVVASATIAASTFKRWFDVTVLGRYTGTTNSGGSPGYGLVSLYVNSSLIYSAGGVPDGSSVATQTDFSFTLPFRNTLDSVTLTSSNLVEVKAKRAGTLSSGTATYNGLIVRGV